MADVLTMNVCNTLNELFEVVLGLVFGHHSFGKFCFYELLEIYSVYILLDQVNFFSCLKVFMQLHNIVMV